MKSTKNCKACKQELPLDQFYADSRGYFQANCITCRAAYDKNLRLKRRDALDRLKKMKGCAICGYNDDPYGLQYDHIDPKDKSFCISGNIAAGRNKLKAELKKCQVLCGTCHNIKTVKENRGEI